MNLLEAVSGFALHHLDERRFHALRSAYLTVRQKLYPAMRALYGTFDAAELRRHLESRIPGDFEILMVHSSVNHMQPMYTGSAMDLVRMLMSFCGPDKTLVMPAFFFGDPQIGGAYETFKHNPRFDVRRVPSQMGLATELFRRMPGVMQSRHPVYRVSALGPMARDLTRGKDVPDAGSGTGNPFDYMFNHNTRIIGIGKQFQVLTQAHHVERVLGKDFPVPMSNNPALPVTVVDGDQEFTVHLSGRGPMWRFNIWKLRDIMDRQSLQEWNFHHVPIFSTRAKDVTCSLIEAAKRGVTLYDKP